MDKVALKKTLTNMTALAKWVVVFTPTKLDDEAVKLADELFQSDKFYDMLEVILNLLRSGKTEDEVVIMLKAQLPPEATDQN